MKRENAFLFRAIPVNKNLCALSALKPLRFFEEEKKMKSIVKHIVILSMLVLPVANVAIANQVIFTVDGNIVTPDAPIRGICLSPDNSKLYGACWEDSPPSRVLEFSLSSYGLLQTISFGYYHTHGDVILSSDGRYLFTTNYYPATVSRIDLLNSNARIDLYAGSSWPWCINKTPDEKRAVATVGNDGRSYDMDNDGISIFDIEYGAFSMISTVMLPDEPTTEKLAFSSDSRFAYVVTMQRKSSTAMLYEVSIKDEYKINRSLSIPTSILCGVALVGDKIFVSDPSGSHIWVVSLTNFNIIKNIDLGTASYTEPTTLATHPNGKDLYILRPGAQELLVMDPTTYSIIGSYSPFKNQYATDIEFNNDGTKVYIPLIREEILILGIASPTIEALVDINPDSLNKNSKGQWVTAYITLPAGFDVNKIDASTIEITSLTGVSCNPDYHQAADLSFTPQVGDRDEDGIADLTVKFSRQTLIANLCLDDVAVTVEGKLTTGEKFKGTDHIRVLDREK